MTRMYAVKYSGTWIGLGQRRFCSHYGYFTFQGRIRGRCEEAWYPRREAEEIARELPHLWPAGNWGPDFKIEIIATTSKARIV